ncbi:MAG: ABC transporter permease [Microscillaceae bacterium]|nr:ABC transporter permease [Microscillaceae bacterium]
MANLGKFTIFIYNLFANRERFVVYVKLVIDECILIGTNSVFIVVIVSTFIGAVSAVQTAYNLISPLIPNYIIGQVVRDMTVLELAPTITCVVLAGKVGSNIAGQLGTMRITEQIDALEVMGINSISYLVLPKILAAVITIPMLVVLAGFLSITGGFLAGTLTGIMTEVEYVKGIRADFNSFSVTFALIKSFVFAFLIASISAYKGFYTRGGALEVGQSSTQAVTNSTIAVLLADFVLAQLLLS